MDGGGTMGDRDGHIIRNPVDLKRKARPIDAKTAQERLRRAEAAIGEVAAKFEGKLDEDIAALETHLKAWAAGGEAAELASLRAVMHNLRGQGSTFGFDLITAIGGNFDRYMRSLPDGARPTPALVGQHVAALRAIYQNGVKGHGDATAKAILAALERAVDKALAKV